MQHHIFIGSICVCFWRVEEKNPARIDYQGENLARIDNQEESEARIDSGNKDTKSKRGKEDLRPSNNNNKSEKEAKTTIE